MVMVTVVGEQEVKQNAFFSKLHHLVEETFPLPIFQKSAHHKVFNFNGISICRPRIPWNAVEILPQRNSSLPMFPHSPGRKKLG